MYRFRETESDSPLYEYVYTVDKDQNGVVDMKLVFPVGKLSDSKIETTVQKDVFPLSKGRMAVWDTGLCMNITEDEKGEMLYTYMKKSSEYNFPVTTIISRYFHPNLFSQILTYINSSEFDTQTVLSDFYKCKFVDNWYNIILPPIKPEYQLIENLSKKSTVNSYQRTFFSYFPPYYAALIMYLLSKDSRIFVISSKVSFISRCAYAIVSLFYPLPLPQIVVPLLPESDFDKIETLKGPRLIGIHVESLKKLEQFTRRDDIIFNTDEPYFTSKTLPKIETKILKKMASFTEIIQQITKNATPAYPAAFIEKELHEVLVGLLSIVVSSPNSDFFSVNEEWSHLKLNETNEKRVFTRSVIFSTLMKISNDPHGSQEVKDAFWPNGTDKNLTMQKKSSMTMSLGRIPVGSSPLHPVGRPKKRSKLASGFFKI